MADKNSEIVQQVLDELAAEIEQEHRKHKSFLDWQMNNMPQEEEAFDKTMHMLIGTDGIIKGLQKALNHLRQAQADNTRWNGTLH